MREALAPLRILGHSAPMTSALRYRLFETPLGTCGLVWSERGLRAVQLPEGNQRTTRQRILERYPEINEGLAPPPVKRAMALIHSLLTGKRPSLDGLDLDLKNVTPFCRRVYQAARQIPPGETLTYGELAQRIGAPGAARAVGRALGSNPLPIVVPCHRILAAGGKLGGFTAHGGVATKQRLLACERGEAA